MNSGHGFYHLSSGYLGGPSGCLLQPIGDCYRTSNFHGVSSSLPMPLSFGSPIWLASPAETSWGAFSGSQGNLFMGGNEKRTMQELNDRLASYLEKVRSLEEANTQLEGCIREWHQKRSHGTQRDFKDYEHNISDMHERIETGRVTNAGLVLQIDNAKMATEDFRLNSLGKPLCFTEMGQYIPGSMRRKNMETHGTPKDFKVNVKVNKTPQEDLSKILAGIRADYEAIIEKNRRSLDSWFQQQIGNESSEGQHNHEELQNSQKEICELNRTLQTLEIDFQTELNKKFALENNMAETKARYTFQLQSIQNLIKKCEEELSKFRHDIKCQNNQYKVLFGIKTRLEREISTYRQLLDGDVDGKTGTSFREYRSSNPNLKKIVQETVDGEVVSTHTTEIKRQA
ncbi:keratin, type I cytoskeletal 23-like [Notechis scutatus]|uniref:Keratin, type I cytoskeletal 23-like n=1 Tax=Notechis scutatus TaxID=8663 RepID=A0A6J1VG33_9SAUR|nr:keratin, type I cytoskeletal 23-like [Notechis scutatus]